MKSRLAVSYFINFVALLFASCVVAGCGGGKNSNPSPSPQAAIVVSPASASLSVGQTQQFAGTTTANNGATVSNGETWNSSNTAVASVNQNGLVTAVGAGSTTITATVQTSIGAVSSGANLTVTAPVSVSVSPGSATVNVASIQTFSATVSNTTNTAVNWAVEEGSAGGTITTSGTYTAPKAAGTFHVIATSQADSTKTGSAIVTVTAPAAAFISTPPSSALENTQYAYKMAATDPAGGTVSFNLTNGPTGAAISGSALTWTPTSAQSRVQSNFAITATTSEGGSATQNFSIAPNGTVHITAIDTYITPSAQTPVVNDLTSANYSILVPDGKGGFLPPLTGSGTANGTFTIANVPAGPYYLALSQTDYLWTSQSNLDLGHDLPGRSDDIYPSTSTLVNFSLSGMTAWAQGDDLELWDPSSDAIAEDFDGFGSHLYTNSPSVGATTYSDTVDWSNPLNPLLDEREGEEAYVLHLGSMQVDGATINYTEDAFGPDTGILMSSGNPTNISGNFSALPLTNSFYMNLDGSGFAQTVAAGAPGAVQSSTVAGLFVAPSGPFIAAAGRYPALVGYSKQNRPITTEFGADQAISYGDPFPTSWMRFLEYRQVGTVQVTAPGATSGATFEINASITTTTLPSANSPLMPLQTVPTTLTINGASLTQQQNAVGTTPTFAWHDSSGAANYRIVLYQLTNQGGTTVKTVAFNATTTSLSLQVPPGVLTSGNTYVAEVEALNEPLDLSTSPFKFALPLGFAATISSPFTP